MTTQPLISCLCVTHRRVPMLRRAVHCFLAQTWSARELLVLHEDGDHGTRDFLAQLAHPQVRSLVVPEQPHLALGAKRQISVQAARGDYIATWDDDDWSAPTRLAEQMRVIEVTGRPACTLDRWIVFDQRLGQAWLSQSRTWEASLLALRSALPPYPALERGEDLAVLTELIRRTQVATLRQPHLYVYTYHGANAGPRAHFKRNIFAPATPLAPAFAQRVAALLAEPGAAPISMAELQAALPPAPPAPDRLRP